MEIKKRSDIISKSPSEAMNTFRKGLLHGAGYDTDKIRTRPLIAIANSHTELTTGHSHLSILARQGFSLETAICVIDAEAPPEATRMEFEG